MSTVHLVGEGILSPMETILAKRTMVVLHKHYPGHPWGVQVNQAVVELRHGRFGKWGYRINTLTYNDRALDAEIVRGGGECLERFKQARGRMHQEEMAHAERDYKGELVPEL